jgi:very-short-patch-repair endonuclease
MSIFANSHPKGTIHEVRDRFAHVRAVTESPIERALAEELLEQWRFCLIPNDRFYDWTPGPCEAAFVLQLKVGRYRLDMAFRLIGHDGRERLVAIECDGKAFHETPDAVERDSARDGYLRNRGWQVWRYPGWLLHHAASEVADEIERGLESLRCSREPALVFSKNQARKPAIMLDYEIAFYAYRDCGVWPSHLGETPPERGWEDIHDVINDPTLQEKAA